jgi:hypothetical protein
MGAIIDTMHMFEMRDLHHLMPAQDGWEKKEQSSSGSGTLYRYSRTVRGNAELATVLVSYDAVVPAATISEVMRCEENGWRNGRYLLLVPQAADVSGVQPPVQVHFMPGFGFRDGKLIWLTKKKNAKKVIGEILPAT